MHLRIGEGLDPIAAGVEDAEAGAKKIVPERWRVVDPAMAVMEVGRVQGMLLFEQTQDDGGLAVEAVGVGDGAAQDAMGGEPGAGALQNLDGVFDVLQHMAEHDGRERRGRLEILNYMPGYVTPEEFFHRMLLSISRMRKEDRNRGVMLVFNSLDQIASRFPLCARERVFIPGIIQTLSSLGVTSVFVAASAEGPEEGPDEGLRNLLSMAELILRVDKNSNFHKATFEKILNNADADSIRTDLTPDAITRALSELPNTFAISELTVERYAGGHPAGMQGMLELVAEKTLLSSLLRPGLQFIPFRPSVEQPGETTP